MPDRILDPMDRISEVLFGLIMALTFTCTLGVAAAEVRTMLIGALGCNLAWGIIDAIMYIMNSMVVRRSKMRLVQAVKRTSDPEKALRLVRNHVEPEFQDLLPRNEAEAFSKSVLKHITGAHIANRILTKEDFYGAAASFWLVFASCLPAAIPFLIFKEPQVALRVSNFLLIASLFYVGQKWGDYAGKSRLAIGLAMVTVGLLLVGIAILLGG